MHKIPMNVPVFIQDVVEDEDRVLFSKAKLKIFYIGETADHRLFTKDFSEKIIQTLPYTPVVAYYSEDDEDFVGHNKTQYVYGLVPENPNIVFEEKDGKTYAITDVILYTGRKDNIGFVASKIVGKQHSLELDPDSLKYKVNRDSQGRFLNLQFLDGEFVGLSVLGDNETPAFTGSEFFTTNEDFKENVEKCKEKFNKFLNLLNSSGGTIKVFNSEAYFNKCVDTFAQMPMQEFIQKIYLALEAAEIYGYVLENTETYAVVSQWDNELNQPVYMKYSISVDGDQIVLGEKVRVYAKYLTQDEIDAVESINTASVQTGTEEEEDKVDDDNNDDNTDSNPVEDEEDEKDEEEFSAIEEPVVENYSEIATNSDTDAQGEIENAKESDEPKDKQEEKEEEDEQSVDTATINTAEEEEETSKIEVGNATADIGSSTLSDSDRSELEQYRREEKLRMIAEYVNDLDAEIIDAFKANVDSYTKEDLESKLAIEFRKAAKSGKKITNANSSAVLTFGLLRTAEKYNEYDPADVINKYKN